MKKILLSLLLLYTCSFAVFVDEPTSYDGNAATGGSANITQLINLNALQKSFFYDKNGNKNNVLNIDFKIGKTYRIRTRYAMNTLIILDNDKIAYHTLGDSVGFDLELLGLGKYDFSNMLVVKPLQIGIDTSLTIIGESGKVYSFYLFSTSHENENHPNLLVFVSSDKQEIEALHVKNLEKEAFEKNAQLEREKNDQLFQNNANDKYLVIGEGINQLKVNRDDIQHVFSQKGKKELMAEDIFRDQKFTYFKYNSKDAKVKFPVVYRVVDGFDNPVNSRVVGDYIIAETVNDKFTLRIGDDYVCVREIK